MTTAGFRFIPIDPQVVEPPVAFDDLDLSRPLADGSVSGSLDITWIAQTPVCVGDGHNPARPLNVGGTYVLPGASLRGMVRAVTEIATFSHLGHINAGRHHGVRDFDFARMPDAHKHRPVRSPPLPGVEPDHYLKAGWLKYEGEKWVLRTCQRRGDYDEGFWLIDFESILEEIARSGATPPDVDTWREYDLQEKLGILNRAQLMKRVDVLDNGPYLPDRSPRGLRSVRFEESLRDLSLPELTQRRNSGTIISGYIVCAGASKPNPGEPGRAKIHEAVFAPASASAGDAHILSAPFMNLFHALHSDPGRHDRDPTHNWRFWLAAKEWLGAFGATHDPTRDPDPAGYRNYPGIPVFYHGDPARARQAAGDPMAERGFFMGLTRVLRLPWPYSVGEVADRLYRGPGEKPRQYQVPRLGKGGGWDFARSLFGEVDDAHLDRAASLARTAHEKTSPRALAGRVAFGPAFAQDNPRPGAGVSGVFGTPRESYYPFYLARANNGSDTGTQRYDDPDAIPAGRKRYIVRRTAAALPQGNANPETVSTVHFLPVGTRFKGKVRFHNLHPVEFGALLWALTFGEWDNSRRYRHQIGRAKAHGYGVLHAEIAWKNPTVINDRQETPQRYLERFRDYMSAQLRDDETGAPREFEITPQIVRLRNYADPSVGDAAARRGLLDTLPLEPPPGRPNADIYPKIKRNFGTRHPAGSRSILRDLLPP